jgi:molybdopterin synthase sulfur carrier subunit
MIQVTLSGALKGAAGGNAVFQVEAANLHQMLKRLGEEHPQLKPILEKGVSVSLNGQIYRDPGFQPIPPGSEIFILPKMAGG